MYKVKFRVYVTKMCRKCGEEHPQPTHRYIYHQAEGTEQEVIQAGHKAAVHLLQLEDVNLRPYYQYSFDV